MLAEVLVATAILAGASAAAIQLTTVSVRGLWTAGIETSATIAAEQKLQQLRGLLWSADASGGLQSDSTSSLSADPPDASGTGLAPSPAGSLEANVDGFVDYLDGGLIVVGSGTVPPAGTEFVRRWAITPLAADPDHTRVLQVLVIPITYAGSRVAGRRAPGEAMLTTALTRVSR
jgi:hypothetical protein